MNTFNEFKAVEIEQIKELMNHLEASKLRKLVIKKGDFEIQIEKEGAPAPLSRRYSPAETATDAPFQSDIPLQGVRGGAGAQESAPGSYVTSPMVGTFYASPAPDQPHFVKVGDKVQEGTVICIIEAMKVMNEVKAGQSGTVAEIIADNGQPVEFGSRLFRIV